MTVHPLFTAELLATPDDQLIYGDDLAYALYTLRRSAKQATYTHEAAGWVGDWAARGAGYAHSAALTGQLSDAYAAVRHAQNTVRYAETALRWAQRSLAQAEAAAELLSLACSSEPNLLAQGRPSAEL